jgi:hypothetical protein
MGLPPHYHRDWARDKRNKDPEWYIKSKNTRTIRRQKAKSDAVARFGSLCNHCGKTYPDCVFEFHHIDDSLKELTPAKLSMYKQETINKELAKCIMLCANCHRIHHFETGYIEHSKRVEGVSYDIPVPMSKQKRKESVDANA